MPINKGMVFSEKDVYIDYPFESVMYRWDYKERKTYVKFYGEQECPVPVPHDNRLFNDALLSGSEITREEYLMGGAYEQS